MGHNRLAPVAGREGPGPGLRGEVAWPEEGGAAQTLLAPHGVSLLDPRPRRHSGACSAGAQADPKQLPCPRAWEAPAKASATDRPPVTAPWAQLGSFLSISRLFSVLRV